MLNYFKHLTLSFLLSSTMAWSDEVDLRGSIADQNGDPIEGFEINLIGDELSAESDASGMWQLTGEGSVAIIEALEPRFDLENGLVKLYGWRGQEVRLILFNSIGQVVEQLPSTRIQSDIELLKLPIQPAQGKYFIHIQSSSFSQSYPILHRSQGWTQAGRTLAPPAYAQLAISKDSIIIDTLNLDSLTGTLDITIARHDLKGYFSGTPTHDSLKLLIANSHVSGVYVEWFNESISPIANFYTSHDPLASEYEISVFAYDDDVLHTLGGPLLYPNDLDLESNFYAITVNNALPTLTVEVSDEVELGEEISWVLIGVDSVGLLGAGYQIFMSIDGAPEVEVSEDTVNYSPTSEGMINYSVRLRDYDGAEVIVEDSLEVKPKSYYYFQDERDGEIYKSVKIGNQIWMANNLRYGSSSSCTLRCKSRGIDYRWSVVVAGDSTGTNVQGICPTGYHVPSRSEFNILSYYVNTNANPGGVNAKTESMKSQINGGTDQFGFNIIGNTTFWSSTYGVAQNAYSLKVSGVEVVTSESGSYNDESLRCIKDDSVLPETTIDYPHPDLLGNDTVFVDPRDNESYELVQIGKQVWMSENLRYNSPESQCSSNCDVMGRKYIWSDLVRRDLRHPTVQGLCPEGFKIPSEEDYFDLYGYVELNVTQVGTNAVGSALLSVQNGGNNEFGFNAMTVSDSARYWTSLNDFSSSIEVFQIINSYPSMIGVDSTRSLHVRCMKKDIDDPADIPTIVDSRDGEEYAYTIIGDQVWLAENLRYNSSNDYFEGGTYSWTEAVNRDSSGSNVPGICPNDFHLPSTDEYETLFDYVEANSSNNAGDALTSKDEYGTDEFGFRVNSQNDFWTSSLAPTNDWSSGNYRITTAIRPRLFNSSHSSPKSIRCVKAHTTVSSSVDNSSSSSSDVMSSSEVIESFTDLRDGEEYTYVSIGSQVWMAQNLRYDNGSASCGASCAVNGRYYDLHEVLDGAGTTSSNPSNIQGICPSGWHLPSLGEFNELIDYTINNAQNSDWNRAASSLISDSEGGSNEFGFNSLLTTDSTSNYWSVTGDKFNTTNYMTLDGSSEPVMRMGGYISEMAVRCVQGSGAVSSSSISSSSEVSSSSSVIVSSSSESGGECNFLTRVAVNASSEEALTSYYATKAIDGSTSTRWNSGYDEDQWITVDLGTSKSVDRVVIKWDSAYAQDFMIRTSETGADGSFNTAAQETNWTGGTSTHDFADVNARYIGVEMTEGVLFSGNFWGYSIQEIEVYEDCDGEVGTSSSSVITSSSSEVSSSSSIQSPEEGRVIAYLPDYRPIPSTEQLQRLTHLIAFSGEPTSTGSFDVSAMSDGSWNIDTLVSRAHNEGVKVMVSLGGAGRSDYFGSVSNSSSLRTKFIGEVMDYVRVHNLDGVDVDWEFPENSTEFNDYKTLLHQLRDSLGQSAQLSIAVGGTTQNEGPSYFASGTFTVLDWVGLMSYDHWYNDANVGGEVHSPRNLINLMGVWDNYIEKDQVVLGVPFYGRQDNSWGTAETYATIIGSSTYTGDSYGGYNYNGVSTVEYKSDYSFSNQYGGIMIWEVGQDLSVNDTRSLLRTIWDSRENYYGSDK